MLDISSPAWKQERWGLEQIEQRSGKDKIIFVASRLTRAAGLILSGGAIERKEVEASIPKALDSYQKVIRSWMVRQVELPELPDLLSYDESGIHLVLAAGHLHDYLDSPAPQSSRQILIGQAASEVGLVAHSLRYQFAHPAPALGAGNCIAGLH